MLEIFTLNADHEIGVTVSDASAVKIIRSRNWSSLVKMCFISLNAELALLQYAILSIFYRC